ncbi:unnamed protein product [Vitrella brassicaformis CCMP3155]|uniref:Uncharacterized protein n=2 Tax=Vitrella brassicaformis TaxID=1169539 RepID=A0A0G4FAP1_VITBC|nr:unnamed protein product [Vitrella brassicaformis CCMP3155]|eukprot:CEM09648.1 unnamed protein product [Vitrella brassicaformis CCMP3155]
MGYNGFQQPWGNSKPAYCANRIFSTVDKTHAEGTYEAGLVKASLNTKEPVDTELVAAQEYAPHHLEPWLEPHHSEGKMKICLPRIPEHRKCVDPKYDYLSPYMQIIAHSMPFFIYPALMEVIWPMGGV